jgi:hypothetical protein
VSDYEYGYGVGAEYGEEHGRHGSGVNSNLFDDLRVALESLADHAEPLLRKVSDAPAGELPATCHWCPLCATLALLRGERPELAVRAAEQGVVMVDLLRAVLGEAEHGGNSARPGAASWTESGHLPADAVYEQPTAPQSSAGGGGPRVQRIAVQRVDDAGLHEWPVEPDDEEPEGKVQRINIRRKDQEP